ncbi:MAG: sensor histidine kinase [Pseudomonadota bacterium]
MTLFTGFSRRFNRLSLARRILIGALIWSAVVVVGGVIAMTAVYRAETINLLDDDLDTTLITLSRAIEPLDDGSGRVRDIEDKLPPDPRYVTPLSGRYWIVVAVDGEGRPVADIRSRSVWDAESPVTDVLLAEALSDPGEIIRENTIGPNLEPVRMAIQAITIPNREHPILLAVANDRTQASEGVNRLRTILLVAMLSLAGGTLIAMVLGLRYALRPLDRVQADLSGIREGRLAALTGNYPTEVQPLSEELNKLLEHNRAVVDRARTHVGNLAHALKTPLAVLRNEARGEGQLDEVVQRQVSSMHANVDHYLKRAQAAARAEALGVQTSLSEAAEGLLRMMRKLFAAEGKTIEAEIDPGLMLRLEKQDLEEMLGNLVDNACKWAQGKVRVSHGPGENGLVLVHIDDDGPGLTEEERETARKRGVRLDETAPGTGLGLSIVSDIAGMNGGALRLSESPLGGLRATLALRQAYGQRTAVSTEAKKGQG